MATARKEKRKPTSTDGKPEGSEPYNAVHFQLPCMEGPPKYKNAREYAQVLRPWLWHYYNSTAFQQMMSSWPLYSPCFQANQFYPSGVSTLAFPSPQQLQQRQPQQHQGDFHQPRAAPAPGQTRVNGHAPPIHRFPGVQCRIPTFWKRVSAELIDFTLLFFIKLMVTIVFMREMGLVDVILDYNLLENLEDLDYDSTFAITSEVIAMEIVNRLLITVFETMCLRRGMGTVGGATPGKRAMGLRVVSCSELQDLGNDRVLVAPARDIGWFSAFTRSAIKNFTIAFFIPACFTVLMFRHNRAAYDVLANTIVVEAED